MKCAATDLALSEMDTSIYLIPDLYMKPLYHPIQRLGLLPTSTPPNDYSPIDFSSYGMTGKRSRLHLMMGSYLEPMVLLKNEGKICDVAAARQVRHCS